MTFNLLIETLASLGGKKGKDCIEYLDTQLLIKEKESGVKYTVSQIGKDISTSQPVVIAYRYYGPITDKEKKKYTIQIYPKDFSKYDKV
jgi:hypothetical protein